MAKILIVEDDPPVLGFLKQLFESAGHEPVTANDGMSGWRQFFASPPDVAVVDLMMPNMIRS